MVISDRARDKLVRLGLWMLVFLFALGSWLGINAIFSQSGDLIRLLPEGKALPAQLNLAIQCSNVLLIMYVLYVFFIRKVHYEMFFVLLVIGSCLSGLILLCFFWDWSVVIGGVYRSLGMLLLTGVVGAANSLSSPIFLPIITQYPRSFTVAFATGEASTGLVAALLALLQLSSGFSISVFFALVAAVQLLSGLAYLLLRFLPASVQLRQESHIEATAEREPLNGESESAAAASALLPGQSRGMLHMVRVTGAHLSVTLLLNWMESGALVALLSYALTPYGGAYYKAGLWGGMIAAPLGILAALAAARGRCWHWMLLWAPTGSFVIVNAFYPILSSSAAFGAFVVACVLIARAALGYNKVLIYLQVQELDPLHSGGLFLVAVAQQVGAVIGSLTFFLVVEYSGMFTGAAA